MATKTKWDTIICQIPENQLEVVPMCNIIVGDVKNGMLECPICLLKIPNEVEIWSCSVCYKLCHFCCMERWGSYSYDDDNQTIRCPSCNCTNNKAKPMLCFCGNQKSGNGKLYLPHSCGSPCNKQLQCGHTCNLLCHPGPCPPCNIQITKSCQCENSQQVVYCGLNRTILCRLKCKKSLKCVFHHFCYQVCHKGQCPPCTRLINVPCYCGRNYTDMICSQLTPKKMTDYYLNMKLNDDIVRNQIIDQLIINDKLGDISPDTRDERNLHIQNLSKVNTTDNKWKYDSPIIPDTSNIADKNHAHQNSNIDYNNINIQNQSKWCPSSTQLNYPISVYCNGSKVTYQVQANLYTEEIDQSVFDAIIHGIRNNQIVLPTLIEEDEYYEEIPVNIQLDPSKGYYSCLQKCHALLECGKHRCDSHCHSGVCTPCSAKKFCACGRKINAFDLEGVKCHSDVTCNNKCMKWKDCKKHRCELKCHLGPCICTTEVLIFCRCKSQSKSIPCKTSDQEFLCTTKCGQKLSCGKKNHRCRTICCPYKQNKNRGGSFHVCFELCNNLLNCGIHKCNDFCHRGDCAKCSIPVTDKKLVCNCGKTFVNPPYSCGSKVVCTNPCSNVLSCGHSCLSNCHFGDCPPCQTLIRRMCIGGHVEIVNVPCSTKYLTCSNLCLDPLPCNHLCQSKCHRPPCPPCSQNCDKLLSHCPHYCKSKCHGRSPCPEVVCSESITRSCKCGRVKEHIPCNQSMSYLSNDNLYLPCDSQCTKIQRSLVVANAFGVDINHTSSKILESNKPMVEYTEKLISWGRNQKVMLYTIEELIQIFINNKNNLNYQNKEMIEIESALGYHNIITLLLSYYNLDLIQTSTSLFIHKSICSVFYQPLNSLSQHIDFLDHHKDPIVISKEPNYKLTDPKFKSILLFHNVTINRSILQKYIEGLIPPNSTLVQLTPNSYLLNCKTSHNGMETYHILKQREDGYSIRMWGVREEDIDEE